ncbi:MAG: hypothetical protein DWQ37_12825 [Planctomycetota bacterium]|nr:MAG: hypothetical protein DWQ37_12825 [Planctomycetota bacterium]
MKQAMYVRWVALLAALFACGCPLGSPNDHSRPIGHTDTTMDVAPSGESLVFNAQGLGGRDLYLLRLDDLSVKRVAKTVAYETDPSFSADGTQLVYSADVQGDRADHVFTRPVSGGRARQLTHADANDTAPRFSPDGTRVVFIRDKTYRWGGLAANWSGVGVVCIVGSDGTHERQLTPDDTTAWDARFSPDGQSVIYATRSGLRTVSIDGSEEPKRCPGKSRADASPDGELIAYTKGEFGPDMRVYVASPDGSSERCLTPDLGGCAKPMFAPQGDRIYFFRTEWPNGPTGVPKSSLWQVDVDPAGQPRKLADYGLFDAPLAWQPKR